MKRSPRRLAWFALCAAFLGCTQVVEFDRSKLADDGGAGGGPGGMGMDAALDSGVVAPLDGAQPDTGMQPPEAGLECSADTDCAANELCCANKCIATSVSTGCEACNTPCSAAADTCTGRSCACGTSASCSGATPFCEAPSEGSRNQCLECRGDDNCTADGQRQCVNGSCVECDVADGNSGCANPTPICDDRTDGCIGCDGSHPCPSGMQCVDGGCYGCDDATNAGCEPNGTTPICERAPSAPQAGLFQCVGCTNDAQCTGNPNGGQCVNGACEACDARAGQNNAGCSGATPICNGATSTCRACRLTGDCTGDQGTCSESGPTAGRCVACTLHSQCSGATPYCDPTEGTCQPCNAFPGGAGLDNAFCAEKDDALPICDTGGRCVRCNASGGCTAPNDQCVVNATAPQNNVCVDCVVSGSTQSGCASGEQCSVVAGMPGMNRCVDCVNDMGCSGMRPRCGPSNMCVECTAPADCSDGNACTSDVCMNNTCSNPPLPTIDDGIACTMDSCAAGTVTHTPIHTMCEVDGFSCTVPMCSLTAGCSEAANHELCTSPTDCFVDMCVGAGGNATTGCSTAPICDGGVCLAGVCTL